MNLAVKECSDGKNDGFRAELQSHLSDGTHDTIVFHDKIVDRLLEDHQIGLILQCRTHRLAIEHAIGLSTGCPYCRAFAGV